MSEIITLGPGDEYVETVENIHGKKGGISFHKKVKDVNTDSNNRDYLWSVTAVGPSGVPSSDTLFLEDGEKVGKKAFIPSEFSTADGKVIHKIEKKKAPKDTKWSYDFGN